MPTKRYRRGRARSESVSDAMWKRLHDEPFSVDDDGSFCAATMDNDVREAWIANRAKVLEWWVANKPGTRPSLWWDYDAPRWNPPLIRGRKPWGTDLQKSEPRQRLGGIGTPCYECLNYAPLFRLGIPWPFVRAFAVEYYNGRAIDVHGNPIKYVPHGETEPATDGHFPYHAIDPNDPPRYESQASYLKRHGLLQKGEAKRLRAADFEPETVAADTDVSRPNPQPPSDLKSPPTLRVVRN